MDTGHNTALLDKYTIFKGYIVSPCLAVGITGEVNYMYVYTGYCSMCGRIKDTACALYHVRGRL